MTFSKSTIRKAKAVWNECCAMKQQVCPRLKPWEVIAIALEEEFESGIESQKEYESD